MPIQDESVEAVRAARESLIKKYGGLHGWIRHLQAMDRRRETAERAKKRKVKKAPARKR